MVTNDELKSFYGWDNIKTETIECFIKNSSLVELKEDTIIYTEGSEHPYFYLILDGFIVINKTSIEGRERYLFFLTREDSFNPYVIDNRKTTTSAKTHTDASFFKIHKDYIKKFMKDDFQFNMMIVDSISRLARRSQRQILNVGIYDTKERIASRLWKLARDYGVYSNSQIYIDLPLTQSDLSNIIGTSRETVNRILKDLEKDGIIQIEDRDIIINDMDKLIEDLN